MKDLGSSSLEIPATSSPLFFPGVYFVYSHRVTWEKWEQWDQIAGNMSEPTAAGKGTCITSSALALPAKRGTAAWLYGCKQLNSW